MKVFFLLYLKKKKPQVKLLPFILVKISIITLTSGLIVWDKKIKGFAHLIKKRLKYSGGHDEES